MSLLLCAMAWQLVHKGRRSVLGSTSPSYPEREVIYSKNVLYPVRGLC